MTVDFGLSILQQVGFIFRKQAGQLNTKINSKGYVFISAAAGGLGKAFSAECASRGWNLFLTDIRADLLPVLAEGLTRQFGVKVITWSADLTDELQRDALWREIDRREMRFSFLINIAGMEYEGEFSQRSIPELRTIVRLNIEAGVEMISQVLGRRVLGSRLYILNVSSMAGFFPMPVKAVYAASKRFILDFSLALREEVRKDNVYVTVLCPSGMPTSERSIRGIKRQGLIGQLTMENVGRVAYRAVQQTLAGKAVYIPGFLNRLLQAVSSLLPPTAKAAFIGRRWHKTRQQEAYIAQPDIHQPIR